MRAHIHTQFKMQLWLKSHRQKQKVNEIKDGEKVSPDRRQATLSPLFFSSSSAEGGGRGGVAQPQAALPEAAS